METEGVKLLKDLKLQIVYKPINSIVGYVNNTRVHPQEQINQIKASIKEFGMCTPIGIHNDTIVYGHGRWEALKQLDYKEVPTLDLSHLTEAQRKAFTIADNKIGDNSSWDEDLLQLELMTLDELGFDYSNLGFDFDIDIEELDDEDFEPNLKEQQYAEKTEIIIECESELQQEELFYKLTNEGYKCRVQSL